MLRRFKHQPNLKGNTLRDNKRTYTFRFSSLPSETFPSKTKNDLRRNVHEADHLSVSYKLLLLTLHSKMSLYVHVFVRNYSSLYLLIRLTIDLCLQLRICNNSLDLDVRQFIYICFYISVHLDIIVSLVFRLYLSIHLSAYLSGERLIYITIYLSI